VWVASPKDAWRWSSAATEDRVVTLTMPPRGRTVPVDAVPDVGGSAGLAGALRSAQRAAMSGALPGALELLGAVLGACPDPATRADAEHLRGWIRGQLGRVGDAVTLLADGARRIAGRDRERAAQMLVSAAALAFEHRWDARTADRLVVEARPLARRTRVERVIALASDVLGHVTDPFASPPPRPGDIGPEPPPGPGVAWSAIAGRLLALSDDPVAAVHANSALAARLRAKGWVLAAVVPETNAAIGLLRSGSLHGARTGLDRAVAEGWGLAGGEYAHAWRVLLGALDGEPATPELASQARRSSRRLDLVGAELVADHAAALYARALADDEQVLAILGRLRLRSGDDPAPRHPDVMSVIPMLVESLIATGREHEARMLLLDFETGIAPSMRAARAAALRCRAALSDDPREVARAARRSIRIGGDLALPFELALSRLSAASCLHGSAPMESRRLLTEAATGFERMGARMWTAVVEAERDRLFGGATRSRAPVTRSSLSSHQLKVALLVADGLSNPQIAERLFVTRRTVEFHLTNVYRKLGVRGRSSLVALMVRSGAAVSP